MLMRRRAGSQEIKRCVVGPRMCSGLLGAVISFSRLGEV
jgi:hypothetical protein